MKIARLISSSKLAMVVTVTVAVCALAVSAHAQNYVVTIDGTQVVPPSGSGGTGSGTLTLDGGKNLTFSITFSGLTGTETAAHIHGPAPVGANAGVVFGLPAGSPKNGVVGPLTPAQEADLNSGLYYVNIHSTINPGGEIRGQILPAPAAIPTLQEWAMVTAAVLLLALGLVMMRRRGIATAA